MKQKPTTAVAPSVHVDGRHARAERTRASIVEALLSLVDEGTLAPTAQEVADRAGVALRSIRQHFATRHDLLFAGALQHATRIAGSHDAVTSEGPLHARLDRFMAARVEYLEVTSGVRRAAAIHAASSQVVTEGIRMLQRERRKEVDRAFARELDVMDEAQRPELLDALHVMASGTSWDSLRRDHGRSRRESAAIVRAGLLAMLKGLPKPA